MEKSRFGRPPPKFEARTVRVPSLASFSLPSHRTKIPPPSSPSWARAPSALPSNPLVQSIRPFLSSATTAAAPSLSPGWSTLRPSTTSSRQIALFGARLPSAAASHSPDPANNTRRAGLLPHSRHSDLQDDIRELKSDPSARRSPAPPSRTSRCPCFQ